MNKLVISVKDFFNMFKKDKTETLNLESINRQIEEITGQITVAEELEQDILQEKLKFIKRVLLKEREILESGVVDGRYIYLSDLRKYISSVEGKQTSTIELNNFDRVIPLENAKKIKEVKDAKIFDKILIVYNPPMVDGLKENSSSEKAIIEDKAARRDPIAFGYFRHEYFLKGNAVFANDTQRDIKVTDFSDKLYYITDWEDEFCDLSLSKVISAIAGLDDTVVEATIPAIDNIDEVEKIEEE